MFGQQVVKYYVIAVNMEKYLETILNLAKQTVVKSALKLAVLSLKQTTLHYSLKIAYWAEDVFFQVFDFAVSVFSVMHDGLLNVSVKMVEVFLSLMENKSLDVVRLKSCSDKLNEASTKQKGFAQNFFRQRLISSLQLVIYKLVMVTSTSSLFLHEVALRACAHHRGIDQFCMSYAEMLKNEKREQSKTTEYFQVFCSEVPKDELIAKERKQELLLNQINQKIDECQYIFAFVDKSNLANKQDIEFTKDVRHNLSELLKHYRVIPALWGSLHDMLLTRLIVVLDFCLGQRLKYLQNLPKELLKRRTELSQQIYETALRNPNLFGRHHRLWPDHPYYKPQQTSLPSSPNLFSHPLRRWPGHSYKRLQQTFLPSSPQELTEVQVQQQIDLLDHLLKLLIQREDGDVRLENEFDIFIRILELEQRLANVELKPVLKLPKVEKKVRLKKKVFLVLYQTLSELLKLILQNKVVTSERLELAKINLQRNFSILVLRHKEKVEEEKINTLKNELQREVDDCWQLVEIQSRLWQEEFAGDHQYSSFRIDVDFEKVESSSVSKET